MPTQALWKYRKLYSTGYVVNQQIPIELTKYEQTGFFNRILINVAGTIVVTGATPGTASNRTNPEDLLVSAILQTSPTVASVVPINQVSGRGLFIDNAHNRRAVRKAAAIANTGSPVLDITYELIFKRKGLRKAVEYGFDISRYTSALLTLTFGDLSRLFDASTNTYNFAGVTVSVYGDMAYNVNPDQIHAVELFEQNFPILATQPDFLVNQLPAGFLYTDLYVLAEVGTGASSGGALSNALLNNIDIEGGGRNWTIPGDNNADMVQKVLTNDCFDGSVRDATDGNFPTNTFPNTGIYIFSMPWSHDGMFSRQVDALVAQIIMKLNVTFTAGQVNNIRLVGRRMLPGAVYKAPPKAAK
jgi:hypothetical protein